jgi:hypothetical protein
MTLIQKIAFATFVILLVLGLPGCGPGQVFGPTLTPSPTITLTPTLTATSTITPTSTPTITPTKTFTPTATPLPVVGAGLKPSAIIDAFSGVDFTFAPIQSIDNEPAQQGLTSDKWMKITIVGQEYARKASLEINHDKEHPFIATAAWILFLEITSRGGKEAADWVHDNYSVAAANGKVEKTFGLVKVIMEVKGTHNELFILTVEPAN